MTKRTEGACCVKCQFWIAYIGSDNEGTCARYPPTRDADFPLGEHGEFSPEYFTQPMTYAGEWCGEFEPK